MGVIIAIAAAVGVMALILTAVALERSTPPVVRNDGVSTMLPVMAALFILVGASAAAFALRLALTKKQPDDR